MAVATIIKTPSNTWKAVVRKLGWPVTIETFRSERDAADWARSTEDEMVRGVYISRAERALRSQQAPAVVSTGTAGAA